MEGKIAIIIVVISSVCFSAETAPVHKNFATDWKKFVQNLKLNHNLCHKFDGCDKSMLKNVSGYLQSYNVFMLGYQLTKCKNDFISTSLQSEVKQFLGHVKNYEQHFADIPSFTAELDRKNNSTIVETESLSGLGKCDWWAAFCVRLRGQYKANLHKVQFRTLCSDPS